MVSPITGQVIGQQEVRVSKNKEAIVDMSVRVLSGIKLNVFADQQKGNGRGMYNVKTTYSKILAFKYQVRRYVVRMWYKNEQHINVKMCCCLRV